MIHTIKFFYIPNRKDYDVFSKVMKPVRVTNYINFHKEEYGFKINYYGKRRMLWVLFTPQKLLGKDIIGDDDYLDFITEANRKLKKYLPDAKVEDLELSQVHYKLDIYTKYKQEYIDLVSKMKAHYYKNKTRIYLNEELSLVNSVYLKCGGYNLNIYLKERQSPHNPKYKDLLRVELQLKRPKLRQIYKSRYIYPEIVNYFSEMERTYFFDIILKEFIYAGDYYSIRRSKHMLSNYYPNKPAIVDKLIKFQKLIGKCGISEAIKLSGKHSQTTKKYLKLLQEAGVNPIPIDNNNKNNHLVSLLSFLHINSNIYEDKACSNF